MQASPSFRKHMEASLKSVIFFFQTKFWDILSKTADSAGQSPSSYTECGYGIIRSLDNPMQELRRSPAQPPAHNGASCMVRPACSGLCPVWSGNTPRTEPASSLGSLPHCPMGREFLPISSLNLSWCNLCLLSHVLTPCGTVKSLVLSSRITPL